MMAYRYWPNCFVVVVVVVAVVVFCDLWAETKSRSIKTQKERTAKIQPTSFVNKELNI